MYRLIEIDEAIAGYELHEDGTYTAEEAENMVKYGTTTPTDAQIQELDDESAVFRSNKDASIHLHAQKLELTHPVKKELICIEAPLPNESLWQACLN